MTTDTPSASPVRASGNNVDAPTSVAAPREHFASRLGFILISAGCAIGLGNVWRFPYIAGEYGGAAFILMYLIFLVILGLPVMVMEFAVGRASQRSAAQAFDILQPSRRWHWFSWWAYIGCMLLMMFYTTVCGWMLAYMAKMATGTFDGLDPDGVAGVFGTMLANPSEMVGWMLAVVVIGFFVCSLGLQKGVERITKVMMIALLGVMALLVVRSVTLPGAAEGLEFLSLIHIYLLAMGGHERLVGCDHILTGSERVQYDRARDGGAADELHHDIDLGIVDDVVEVVGEQVADPVGLGLGRRQRAHARQLDIHTEVTQEVVLVLLDDVDAPAADGAGAHQADFHCHVTSSPERESSL